LTYVVTGAAGFIGFHTAKRLLDRGDQVIGLDVVNDYYEVGLKETRLKQLEHPNFTFHRIDLADMNALKSALAGTKPRRVVHLAAQAGVRYSIENPHAYIQANVVAHVNVLEYFRYCDSFEAMTYASSSSVYGGLEKTPFSESDKVDDPISLYAATKKADEVISSSYSHLYKMPLTGLRFFSVYGPWGRPDMAMWLFTDAILNGRPISVFNHGDMRRDFTYVDDIVSGVVAVTDNPSTLATRPHRIYNIGNNRPEELMHMISLLEQVLGRKAEKVLLPMQPGDAAVNFADIDEICRDHGFQPTTTIEAGIPLFVEWFKRYRGIS
jgi:UDP-glucuronate 4-epimerase